MTSFEKRLEKIPRYDGDGIDEEHATTLKATISKEFDPFGESYSVLKNSLQIESNYQDLNVPDGIIWIVISFLDYCESTMDLKYGSAGTSNCTLEYGTEALIIISPPKKTLLPSNIYILDTLRYKIGKWKSWNKSGQIFIGIQLVDFKNMKCPGNDHLVYSQKMDFTEQDEEFIINPLIELQCGKVYMFWITCVEGTFHSELIDGHDVLSEARRNELKFTNSDLMYYMERYGNGKGKYTVLSTYMNYYTIVMRPKV